MLLTLDLESKEEDMEKTENLLEVKNLKVSFQTFFGEVEAVRGISFNVPKSKTVAIVGESGCGKSVTANSIMKLLQIGRAHV